MEALAQRSGTSARFRNTMAGTGPVISSRVTTQKQGFDTVRKISILNAQNNENIDSKIKRRDSLWMLTSKAVYPVGLYMVY